MKEVVYTPGPWKVTDRVFNGDEIGIGTEEGSIVAGAWPFGGDETGDEIREANARLIAAAPALLAACKQTLLALFSRSGIRPHDGTPSSEAMNAANAAIKAATGEDMLNELMVQELAAFAKRGNGA